MNIIHLIIKIGHSFGHFLKKIWKWTPFQWKFPKVFERWACCCRSCEHFPFLYLPQCNYYHDNEGLATIIPRLGWCLCLTVGLLHDGNRQLTGVSPALHHRGSCMVVRWPHMALCQLLHCEQYMNWYLDPSPELQCWREPLADGITGANRCKPVIWRSEVKVNSVFKTQCTYLPSH